MEEHLVILMSDFVHFQHILWLIILEGGIYGVCSLCVAGVKRIQSPREPNPGQIIDSIAPGNRIGNRT